MIYSFPLGGIHVPVQRNAGYSKTWGLIKVSRHLKPKKRWRWARNCEPLGLHDFDAAWGICGKTGTWVDELPSDAWLRFTVGMQVHKNWNIRKMYGRNGEFHDHFSYTSWCPWCSSMVSKKGGRWQLWGLQDPDTQRDEWFGLSRNLSTKTISSHPFLFWCLKPHEFFCACQTG